MTTLGGILHGLLVIALVCGAFLYLSVALMMQDEPPETGFGRAVEKRPWLALLWGPMLALWALCGCPEEKPED